MTLDPDQRKIFDSLGDFTEDTFLQPHYMGLLMRRLREIRDAGIQLKVDATIQWAREREWTDLHAGMLAGIVQSVRHENDPF